VLFDFIFYLEKSWSTSHLAVGEDIVSDYSPARPLVKKVLSIDNHITFLVFRKNA